MTSHTHTHTQTALSLSATMILLAICQSVYCVVCMCQQRGYGTTSPRTTPFSEDKRSYPQTHDTPLSRRVLYQLSYQGNSAGRGSNLQHKTMHTTVLWHSILSLCMCNSSCRLQYLTHPHCPEKSCLPLRQYRSLHQLVVRM